MTREEQLKINTEVESIVSEVLSSSRTINWDNFTVVKRQKLRSCQAEVVTLENKHTGEVNYALKSFATYIAFERDGKVYDFLRYVYTYTKTSGGHFAKFYHDFCNSAKLYRWY